MSLPQTRHIIALILLSLALFLPGLTALPPLDRDEARFAQTSRQMIESGDYIRLRFQDEARNKKPVGVYWLQAGSARLAQAAGLAGPEAIWPYRVPSVAGALLAVLFTYAVGVRLYDRRIAFVGAALTAAALQVVIEAHLAKTDAVLLACAVAAQGILGAFYVADRTERPRPGLPAALAFWIAQGAAILVKGPVVPMVSALTVLTLAWSDRRKGARFQWLRGLRPLIGVAVTGAIVLPWLVAIGQATDGGFVSDAVRNDLLPKLIGGQESHGAPPGYYLLLSPLVLWPAAIFGWLGFAWAVVHRRAEPAERFLLAWIVPTWLLFEAIPTKLPHYVLPAWPALALLGAAWLGAASMPRPKWGGRVLILAWAAVGIALGVGIVGARVHLDHAFVPGSLLPAFAALAAAGLGALWLWRGAARRTAVAMTVGAVAVFAPVFGWLLPDSQAFWVSRAAANAVAAHSARPPLETPVVAVGYHEPSLVFLLGTRTKLAGDGAAAAEFLAHHPDALALVAAPEEEGFAKRAMALEMKVERAAIVSGLNYSRGKPVSLALYRRN